MDTKTFINKWIEAGNDFNTAKYLNFYLADAVLDDPSVGRKFLGHEEIEDYFSSYLIGYKTHTQIVKFDVLDEYKVNLEVKFTGDFPQGEIGGTFEITFKNNKISHLKADLIH